MLILLSIRELPFLSAFFHLIGKEKILTLICNMVNNFIIISTILMKVLRKFAVILKL